jgi:eukaryotic-like serine/threonine-protein kinase
VTDRPTLDGYAVDALIGFGRTGEVWRARDLATGETVAIKRLRAGGFELAERLRRELTLLGSIAGPHLVGVRRLVEGDPILLVLDYAAGGNLASVLGIREQLPPAEVVTVLAPIAAALGAAHERDLVHGDLTPANVVFAGDGRPLLTDFGLVPAVDDGFAGTPEDDVYALGMIGFTALAGRPPGGVLLAAAAPDTPAALIVAVESMLAIESAERPPARLVARSLLRACDPAPVGLVRNVPTPPPAPLTPSPTATRPIVASEITERLRGIEVPPAIPPTQRAVSRPTPRRPHPEQQPQTRSTRSSQRTSKRPSNRAPNRRVRRLGTLVTILAAIAVLVTIYRRHPPAQVVADRQPTSSPSAPAATTAPGGTVVPGETAVPASWKVVVARLDATRARAFDLGRPATLLGVYVPGSAAYLADRRTLQSLASRGLHAAGFAATVKTVTATRSTSTTANLRVVDQLSAYSLVDGSGAVVGHGAARPARAFTMDLARVDGSWRVAAIHPSTP